VKLSNVWVVEGAFGNGGAGSLAPFDVNVDATGWTLHYAEEPMAERAWPWSVIGGLTVVRGAGHTPDGRPATALDVIVNGWPVRIIVPTQDMPNETVAMLGAFAPVGHPLRASPRVTRQPVLRRLSAVGRRSRPDWLGGRPVLSRSGDWTRLRWVLVGVVVLGLTVAVAEIAGVATNGPAPKQPPVAAAAHSTTVPHDSGSTPGPTGVTSSSQPPAPTSTSTTAPSAATSTSVKPAVAASSAKQGTTATTAKGTTTTKPSTATTGPGATTPTVPAPTTASTITTVAPTTTTTRGRRPTRPTTTTTTSTTTVPSILGLPLP